LRKRERERYRKAVEVGMWLRETGELPLTRVGYDIVIGDDTVHVIRATSKTVSLAKCSAGTLKILTGYGYSVAVSNRKKG
jgi:hypothetical protein